MLDHVQAGTGWVAPMRIGKNKLVQESTLDVDLFV